MEEQQYEEKDVRCGISAACRYTWPGQDEKYACLIHGHDVKHLADVMGFYLQLIPVSTMDVLTIVETGGSPPVCESVSRVKLPINPSTIVKDD